jgi:single-stranded DNA-binding protein
MAGSVNKVILIGNLGRDPEVRTFQNGGKRWLLPKTSKASFACQTWPCS